MAKTYKGSLSLEWYNKQKSVLLQASADAQPADIPAPRLNWVNKEEALFYEIDETEGKGKTPYWVDRNDIRVKEARPLMLQKVYKAVPVNKPGSLPGMDTAWRIEESEQDDSDVENILIKGDNLLALNTLKKMFDNKPEEEKIKCIYIDPPYNTQNAFLSEYYEDNLEHSEWLTLMRDRLTQMKEILSVFGIIVVQISDKQVGYLQVLLDEIYGRSNFINKISIRTKSPSGFQTVNLGVFETAEYLLIYGKDKTRFTYIPQFTECDYDTNYDKIILNKDNTPSTWKFTDLLDFVAIENGIKDIKEFKKSNSKQEIERILGDYAIKYADMVFRLTSISDSGAGKETVEIKHISKNSPNKIFVQKREDYPDRYILNGQEIAFYAKKIKLLNGKKTPTVPLTNIWNDVAWEGISREGGVEFPKSKKPEKLIQRILEFSTKIDDCVLDVFGGSGTTYAVGQKLNRKWIGVEVGNHADSLILERLKSVLSGEDQSGVTKTASWRGGGSFKYYHLGESIIKTGANGQGDFNWSLGRKHIEESFLFSYDYKLATDFQSPQVGELPAIGIQHVGNDIRVAIISLCGPEERGREMLGEDELMGLYKAVNDQYKPRYINVFTNRGVELAYDAKPDKLDVIKVPHAIFSELEK